MRPSSSLVNDFERQKLSHHFLKAEAAKNRIDAANSRHIRRAVADLAAAFADRGLYAAP